MARKFNPKQTSFFKKEIPPMPAGYYSGDQPNPTLRRFVEEHAKPYDPETDNYNIPPFDKPIKTTKATALYDMHSYHQGKKTYDAIRQYIRHYTQPGDLVLDPMCGSGGTALAALMEGRAAIAIDRSPAATFITKNYCTPVDVDEMQAAFEELQAKVKPEMDWLYETRCDRCDGRATTAYTVYSYVFRCPRCLEKMPLFDCVAVESQTAAGKPKTISACPYCYIKGHIEEISTRSERFEPVPVLVSYLCEEGCRPQRGQRLHNDPDQKKRAYFERYDLGKLAEIEAKPIPHWYPPHRMMNVESDTEPWGDEWRPGRDFRTVAELFTKRNLWALTAYFDVAKDHKFNQIFQFILTGSCLHGSKMSHHKEGGGGITVGTYYLPQMFKERNVSELLSRKFNDVNKAEVEIGQTIRSSVEVLISTQTATNLSNIPSNSVDYIFTDPPYGNRVQYGELNFIWEAWLGFDAHWHDEEIIVNRTRGKTDFDWAKMLQQAMNECYRVLKPGHWLSLCYHDTSEGTWQLIQDLMTEVGFIPDLSGPTLYIDTAQKSYNQYIAERVTKEM